MTKRKVNSTYPKRRQPYRRQVLLPKVSRCVGCGIVERSYRPLVDGYCERCHTEAARGANMTPVQEEPRRPVGS
jgi:hypothetical protein